MKSNLKPILMVLGGVSALLIIAQLVMGLLLVGGSDLRKAHQHSGYLTVTVSLVYIALSLSVIASMGKSKS